MLLARGDFLLCRDCALPRSFAGARIGVRALSPRRQAAAVAQSTVGLNVDEALDVHRDVLAEIAFDVSLVLDNLADAVYLVFAEILDLLEWVNIRRSEDAQRTRVADPVDVSERDPGLLVAGQIDASNTCHALSFTFCSPEASPPRAVMPMSSFDVGGD